MVRSVVGSHGNDSHVLPSVPAALDLLSSAAADGALPVHLPVLERTHEALPVMPSESSLGVVHQSIEELTLIGSVISDQFALGLLTTCKLSLVKGPSTFNEQLTFAIDVSVNKLSLVYFAIGPGVLAFSVFLAVLEVTLIAACVGVVLHSATIGPVVPPVAIIDCPVGFVGELAESVKGVIFEMSDVVGAIRVDEETLLASSHSSNERPLVEDAVFAIEATSAVRSPLAPLSVIEATSHGC